jgi:hypothetical protein
MVSLNMNFKLPINVIEFIKHNNIIIEEKYLNKTTYSNDILISATYTKDDLELRWFENEDICYLFVNGVNVNYLDENKVFYINN